MDKNNIDKLFDDLIIKYAHRIFEKLNAKKVLGDAIELYSNCLSFENTLSGLIFQLLRIYSPELAVGFFSNF